MNVGEEIHSDSTVTTRFIQFVCMSSRACKLRKLQKISHVQSDESKYNFITVGEVQVQSPEFKTRDPEFS